MKVAAIQMTSGPDVGANLEQARELLEEAAARGARLAALPENFSFMGLKDADKRAVAEADGQGPAQDFLADISRRLKLWIVGGTVPLRAGAEGDGRVAAASLVYDPDGRRAANRGTWPPGRPRPWWIHQQAGSDSRCATTCVFRSCTGI